MSKLDQASTFKRLDRGQVAESISALSEQVKQVLNDSCSIKVPASYAQVRNVVVNGMGGSNLGSRIFKAVMSNELKVPFNIVPGYSVPAYVGKDTLFILSSYSGTTEETLSVYKEARKRGAKILMITSQGSGQLEKWMRADKVPGFVFDPRENPSGQPRLGVGYSIFGIAIMLSKAGLFKIKNTEIEAIINNLRQWDRKLRLAEPTRTNAAKTIASLVHKHIPVLASAEHLTGNLHAMRNQFCENAKNFADYLTLPELNHYAMEGLSFPAANQKNLIFIFFNSALFHPRIARRLALTQAVVKKNGIATHVYKLKGKTKLDQAFELLQLGAWITYYTGILNGVDPVKIPWVDWFKKELK